MKDLFLMLKRSSMEVELVVLPSTEPGLEPLHFLKLKDGLFYWLSTCGLESGTLRRFR
ncbi:hypothetical protein SDJN02_15125 [Cucurbita argyrosperma subsp. argyrosperma]|nr:hypothetical protein SDJN02_15125 [Cucurbita argyrosperma subsp. argyrosperma]